MIRTNAVAMGALRPRRCGTSTGASRPDDSVATAEYTQGSSAPVVEVLLFGRTEDCLIALRGLPLAFCPVEAGHFSHTYPLRGLATLAQGAASAILPGECRACKQEVRPHHAICRNRHNPGLGNPASMTAACFGLRRAPALAGSASAACRRSLRLAGAPAP